MKKILIIFTLYLSQLLATNGFYNSGETKGIMVEILSEKILVEGKNNISIILSKDNQIIDNAKVRVKFFMPEMPGMPYMEYIGNAEFNDNKYNTLVNFSMGGTWQYQVQFKLHGKKYLYRGSVNLGQSNNMKCGAGKCGHGK